MEVYLAVWDGFNMITFFPGYSTLSLSLSVLPVVYYFQSCTRGGSELTYRSIYDLRGWSNTENRLLRELVSAPSLTAFKKSLVNALNNIL